MRFRQTPLSGPEVRGLNAGPKRSTHALGKSLFLVIELTNRGNRKQLFGRSRQPLGRQSVVVPEVAIIQYLQKF